MDRNELKPLQLIRPTQAAEILGVHVKTLARWRGEKRGPGWYDMPQGAMYDRGECERFVAAGRKEPQR